MDFNPYYKNSFCIHIYTFSRFTQFTIHHIHLFTFTFSLLSNVTFDLLLFLNLHPCFLPLSPLSPSSRRWNRLELSSPGAHFLRRDVAIPASRRNNSRIAT